MLAQVWSSLDYPVLYCRGTPLRIRRRNAPSALSNLRPVFQRSSVPILTQVLVRRRPLQRTTFFLRRGSTHRLQHFTDVFCSLNMLIRVRRRSLQRKILECKRRGSPIDTPRTASNGMPSLTQLRGRCRNARHQACVSAQRLVAPLAVSQRRVVVTRHNYVAAQCEDLHGIISRALNSAPHHYFLGDFSLVQSISCQ